MNCIQRGRRKEQLVKVNEKEFTWKRENVEFITFLLLVYPDFICLIFTEFAYKLLFFCNVTQFTGGISFRFHWLSPLLLSGCLACFSSVFSSPEIYSFDWLDFLFYIVISVIFCLLLNWFMVANFRHYNASYFDTFCCKCFSEKNLKILSKNRLTLIFSLKQKLGLFVELTRNINRIKILQKVNFCYFRELFLTFRIQGPLNSDSSILRGFNIPFGSRSFFKNINFTKKN